MKIIIYKSLQASRLCDKLQQNTRVWEWIMGSSLQKAFGLMLVDTIPNKPLAPEKS